MIRIRSKIKSLRKEQRLLAVRVDPKTHEKTSEFAPESVIVTLENNLAFEVLVTDVDAIGSWGVGDTIELRATKIHSGSVP